MLKAPVAGKLKGTTSIAARARLRLCGGTTSVGAIIVLADDEPDLRSIYAASLRSEGFDVREASDGREALDLVEAHHPALLLLDVWMPELNGLEVVERLRNDPAACQMRVVMLSNLGDSDTRFEGFSAGVTDYWIKTLSLVELCRRVRELVAEPRAECAVAEFPATSGD
jgi:DNA-binding response OmpR family regulator